jgi:hypothetical protein
MKRTLLLLSASLLYFTAFGQRVQFNEKMESRKGEEIICPAIYEDANTFRDIPEDIKKRMEARIVNGDKSIDGISNANIIVDYQGFTPTAQASFQRAINIWSNILKSDVTVRVIAFYQPLGPSVLGSATAGDFNRNFPGAPKANTWYPIALAEKIAGRELNSVNDYDIVCRFSNEVQWYFGRIAPAVGQFDFESVVLHELCHGLGFIGSMSVNESNNTASYGFGSTSPFIFDSFTETRAGLQLTDTTNFKNNTRELRSELLSNDLFFNSPIAKLTNNGTRPRLYAPNQWSAGSSFSHLDDATYPAGDENSLMTSGASLREKNLDPGPITRNMFIDMGWQRTSIVHDQLKDRLNTDDIIVTAKILSDTTFSSSTPVLVYSLNTAFVDSVVVPLEKVSGNTYQATIRTGGVATDILYYMKVGDDVGRVSTSPPSAPAFIWSFKTGQTDKLGPTIDYASPSVIPAGNGFAIVAAVEDDFQEGVEKVVVNYSKNGIVQTPFELTLYNDQTNNPQYSQGFRDSFSYIKESAFGDLTNNDRITYQLVATDKAGNITTLPTRNEGTETDSPNVPTTYELVATSLNGSVSEYFNDFNTSTTDFALVGFDVNTPAGFNDGNLNTQEGYSNGKGLSDPDPAANGRTLVAFENNQIALLRSPIILDSDQTNATISFNEVVLVEPGEDGTTFTDQEFWDFVVVEGSIDGGQSWTPFADGYDSRDDRGWLNRFTSTLSPGTAPVSNGKGEQALYKQRVIRIFDGGFKDTAPGTEVIIRFRLFSDQWVRGWGWAIDDLRLQIPAPKPLAAENIVIKELTLSPNPATDYINLAYTFQRPQEVHVEVFSINGGKLLNERIETIGNNFNYSIDVRNYNAGAYVVKVTGVEGFKAKKFVVAK